MELKLPIATVTEPKPGTVATPAGFVIAVFLSDGNFFALANACPHRGAPLALGLVDEGAIICPLHHFKFDLKSGRCRLPRDLATRTFAVARDGDTLVITVPDEDATDTGDGAPLSGLKPD
jgi:nitrite reductase (NADH) small subunit